MRHARQRPRRLEVGPVALAPLVSLNRMDPAPEPVPGDKVCRGRRLAGVIALRDAGAARYKVTDQCVHVDSPAGPALNHPDRRYCLRRQEKMIRLRRPLPAPRGGAATQQIAIRFSSTGITPCFHVERIFAAEVAWHMRWDAGMTHPTCG